MMYQDSPVGYSDPTDTMKNMWSTCAHGVDKRTAWININIMDDRLVKDCWSYCRMTWSGKHHLEPESPVGVNWNVMHPDSLKVGKNIVALENPNSPDLEEVTRKEVLKHEWLPMVEHWAALPVLLQTPMAMHFYQNDTPYCMSALAAAGEFYKERKKSVDELVHKTIDKPFDYVYEDPNGGPDVKISFKPRTEPGVKVNAYFNFKGHKAFDWVGEQYAEFDSNDFELLDYTLARAPSSNPLFNLRMKIKGYFTHETCFVTKNDKRPMQKDEIARHKILDQLGTFIVGPFNTAFNVDVEYAGHFHHVDAMQQLIRNVDFVRL